MLAVLGYVVRISFPELQTTKDVSDMAARYSHEIGYGILAIVALVIVFYIVRHYVKRRSGAPKA